jgi:hypothetical protein
VSDDKKPEAKEPAKPLSNPEVNVNVIPQNEKVKEHKDAARTLQKQLTEQIKKAVEKNIPGGKDKQFEAVKEETKKVGNDADPRHIKEVRVNVAGTDQDGDTEKRTYTVPTEKTKAP